MLAACAGPLFSNDADYDPGASIERLRIINSRNFDSYEAPTPPPEQLRAAFDEKRAEYAGRERVPLSIEDVREAVLENNLDLEVARVAPAIANQNILEEEGRFEAIFTTSAIWSETDAPTSSRLTSAQSTFASIEPAVQVPLRTGGTAEFRLPMTRSRTNNEFSTLNPAYTSDLEFSLSHNLLRGAGRRVNTAGIRIAGIEEQISRSQLKAEAIRQIAAGDRAYWRLYQAEVELDVRQRELELAEEQLARAQRRVDAGDVAEIEVLRAQAGRAERFEAIIRAETLVRARERELKSVVNIPGLGLKTPTRIEPSSPPDPVRYEFDRSTLIDEALAGRMEMLELELRLAADVISIDARRNEALPLLVMDYTYRLNGLGESLGDASEVMAEDDYEDWSVGLRAEIPIGNEQRNAAVRRAILTRLQRLATRDAREQAITVEVLGAIDEIDSAWQRLLAARQTVILNGRTLQAEQRQFDVGQSTSTDVLDASARLADAQSAEVRALVDYQVAQVDLAFATGTLLGQARVEIEANDPFER